MMKRLCARSGRSKLQWRQSARLVLTIVRNRISVVKEARLRSLHLTVLVMTPLHSRAVFGNNKLRLANADGISLRLCAGPYGLRSPPNMCFEFPRWEHQ